MKREQKYMSIKLRRIKSEKFHLGKNNNVLFLNIINWEKVVHSG